MLQEELRANVRHNFVVNIVDAVFFGMAALGLASSVTVIPLFLNTLTDSTILIGLVTSLQTIGWTFPQLLTASYVARLKRYKPMVIFMTIHERWPYFGLMAVALLVPVLGPSVSVLLVLVMLAIHAFGGGFAATAWQSMIGKIMPQNRVGTFFGVQSAAANLMGAVGALVAGFILDRMHTPHGFALCFFLAGVAMAISFTFLARTREPAHEISLEQSAQGLGWRRMVSILREDGNFRWYIVARLLAALAWMAIAFYTIYAVRHFHMDDITAGALTFVLMFSQTIANPILGWIGDRWSHRVVYASGALMMAASAAVAVLAPEIGWFYVVFALAGAANATSWATAMTFPLEFGKDAEKPLYIGLANTLIAPLALAAPLLGGWLADNAGFQSTFLVSVVCGILAAVVLLFGVINPRRLRAQRELLIRQAVLETPL
jgi:MFS family permease